MTVFPVRKLGVWNSYRDPGMHEMRRSEAVQHHPHRHVDGRREVYAAHKLNDKGSSSQINKSDRDHRSKQHVVTSQIPGAIRICGDWSEHLSSNGKVYFFNNKTKSSQWERPKEWSSSRTVEVKKDKSKSSNLHNKVVAKHSTEGSSSGGQQHLSRQHKSHQAVEGKKVQVHSRHRPGDAAGSKDFRDRDYRTLSSNSSAKDRDYRDIDYRDANSSRSSTDSRLSNNTDSHTQHRVDRDYRSAGPGQSSRRPGSNSRVTGQEYNGKSASSLSNDTQRSSRPSETSIDGKASVTDSSRTHHRDEGHDSNHSTPRSVAEATKRDWQGAKKGSADNVVDTVDSSTAANGEATPTTSALVQTLSSVLNQASTTTKNEEDTSIQGNLKNALQMLLDVAARNQNASSESAGNKATEEAPAAQQPVVKTKPVEEPSVRRQHTYTDVIEEHVRNAKQVSDNSEQLLNSIRAAVDERHILHVQGWSTDQLEQQSYRLSDDNHQFVVNHTSELCASMKVARSQVRSAEIHSTLQEQRVLYLRQQIKDLEKSTTIAPFT